MLFFCVLDLKGFIFFEYFKVVFVFYVFGVFFGDYFFICSYFGGVGK